MTVCSPSYTKYIKTFTCTYDAMINKTIGTPIVPVINYSANQYGQFNVTYNLCTPLDGKCNSGINSTIAEDTDLTLDIVLNTIGAQGLQVNYILGVSTTDCCLLGNGVKYYENYGLVYNYTRLMRLNPNELEVKLKASNVVNQLYISMTFYNTGALLSSRRLSNSDNSSVIGIIELPTVYTNNTSSPPTTSITNTNVDVNNSRHMYTSPHTRCNMDYFKTKIQKATV